MKFNHGKYLEIMEIMKDTSVSFDELEKKLSGENNKLFSEESVREVINKPEDI